VTSGTIALFFAGLALLVVGAEILVRGASNLAVWVGISPLVVGLTVVALGTSAPEMAVTIGAASRGGSEASLALGNVVGSNIANVLLILGLAAVVVPLTVAQQLVRIEVPLLIAVSAAVLAISVDGTIGRIDGLLLVAAGGVYLGAAVVQSRRETRSVKAEYREALEVPPRGLRDGIRDVGLVLGGLGLLVVGARWLVGAAVVFASTLGVSELVIGLTIVAVGTSMPEIATSVVAATRGQRDIAVGNVVGSNLLNLLMVLGTAAVIAPDGVTVPAQALVFDLPVMVAVALACLPVFYVGGEIRRWEGALFLVYYVAYVAWLVMQAQESTLLPGFTAAMLYFVLPLTAVTYGVISARELRRA
jgi:cation:H+ antiporter